MSCSAGLTATVVFDATGSTTTLTLTGTTVAGSTISISMGWTPVSGSTSADPTIAGNSLTYNKRVSKGQAGTNSAQCIIWDVVNAAAQTNLQITVTHANTGYYGNLGMIEIKGADTAPFEAQNSNNGIGTNPTMSTNSASNTTTDGFAVAIGAVDSGTNPAITTDPPSGYTTLIATIDATAHLPTEINYKVLTSAAGNSASWNTDSTGSDGAWAAAIAVYKGTGGGGGGSTMAGRLSLLGVGL